MSKAKYTIETFRAVDGEHRFNILEQNGQVVAVASQGYGNRSDMLEMLKNLRENLADAEIVKVEK
jgi:uncharacterized protein YegP (UPF0339 family)